MKSYYVLIFLLVAQSAFSQKIKKDTVVELKSISISAERLNDLSIGHKIEIIDSVTLSNYSSSNIGDLLLFQTPVYVKTYGLGSVANMTIRGTTAQQSAVLWNGFNINTSSSGITDLALLPVFFFSNVNILYGGGSSIYGNGMIGGSLHLINNPVFNKGNSFDINISAASFENYNISGKANISGPKLNSSTAFIYNTSKNNFLYINNYKSDKPEEKQLNADIRQYGIMQDLNYKISANQIIKASIWYQYADRDIPPSLDPFNPFTGKAKLTDDAFRSLIQWSNTNDKMMLAVKAAYFYNREHYVYSDPFFPSDSRTNSGNAMTDIEYKRKLGKNNELYGGINYTFNYADVKDYDGKKQQSQGAGFISYIHHFFQKEWKGALNIRKEIAEGYTAPLTPSIGVDGKIWRFIYCRFNVSQNFRGPTFNDRYWWQPPYSIGNPNLKPEISINEEAGIIFKSNSDHRPQTIDFKTEVSATAFNSQVDNLIQWVDKGNYVYIPDNINKVHSRGLEVQGKIVMTIRKFNIRFNTGYFYTKSTNEKKTSETDMSYKKQLVYTPEQTGNAGLTFGYKNYEVCYYQTYTGKRFINADNSKSLEPYSLGNFKIIFKHNVWKQLLRLQFDIDNIWNVNYHAIDYYPMPGRIYRLTLNYKI